MSGTSLRRATDTRRPDQSGERESDDSLLARIGAGDRSAWGVLVDRHLAPVTRYASYVLRDAARAEDVAQETFFRLMCKAPDWQTGGATLRTWLFRVALNLCIDIKRARKPESMDAADTLADPVDAAVLDDRIDLERTVQTAIAALPARQQTAIVLVHYEGFSGEEAAAVLDVSVEAVESLLARGRRTLRQSLSSLAPDLLPELRE